MTTILNSGECFIYPGEYTPRPELESLLKESRHRKSEQTSSPQVNIDELDDSFVVEAIMPGTRREDIMVETRDNTLSILVASRAEENHHSGLRGLKRYLTKNLERHIFLPQGADTEFLSAEFRKGILRIVIPKGRDLRQGSRKKVVVY